MGAVLEISDWHLYMGIAAYCIRSRSSEPKVVDFRPHGAHNDFLEKILEAESCYTESYLFNRRALWFIEKW